MIVHPCAMKRLPAEARSRRPYPRGVEQSGKSPAKAEIPETGGAESGALPGDSPPKSDLSDLARKLAGLSADDRARLAAMLAPDAGRKGRSR